MDVTQQPMNTVPQQAEIPATPIPSTTPELEQVLVKIQELEQRIGDLELAHANEVGGEGEGLYEKLLQKQTKQIESLILSLKKEDMKGLPEIEKGKKEKPIGPEGTNEVPQAQDSEINYDAGGEKTGAPVAGEETGLDKGEPAEKDAEGKVKKPKSDFPHETIQKNALEGEDGVPNPGKPTEKPKAMEDEEGTKVPKNKSDGFEEHFNSIKQKLSGRQSFVGMAGGSNLAREAYANTKDDTNSVIKEYLRLSKVRI